MVDSVRADGGPAVQQDTERETAMSTVRPRTVAPPFVPYAGTRLLAGLYDRSPFPAASVGMGTVPRTQRPVSGFAAAQSLPLDPIAVPTLRLDRLIRLLPCLAEVLCYITDIAAFESLLLPSGAGGDDGRAHRHPMPQSRPIRPAMEADVPELIASDMLVPIARRRVREVIGMFKVPKSDEVARLIGNAIPVNKRQRAPPPVDLPSPIDIVHRAARFRFFAQVDLRHFFYQFGLGELVRAFFCIRRRGGPPLAFTRMPMGWTWAMYVAQRVAEALANAVQRVMTRCGHTICIRAYVDGLILMVMDVRCGQVAMMLLLLLLHRVRSTVNWKKSQLEFLPTVEFVGLQLDSERHGFRLLPSWCDRLHSWYEEKLVSAIWTWRDILLCAGSIVWAWYARQLPFSKLRPMFNLVSWVVSSPKSSWDEVCPSFVPDDSLDAFLRVAVEDVWESFRGTEGHTFAETDATPWSWGHVFTTARRAVYQTCFGAFASVLPIHIAEMVAAVLTIYHVAVDRPGTTLVLGIDNEIVKWVLRKGHSPVDALNLLAAEADNVARWGRLFVLPVRVSTDNNMSDEPSRRCHPDGDVSGLAAMVEGEKCPGYASRQGHRQSHPPTPDYCCAFSPSL